MPFFLSAIGNEQQFNANGSPLSGGKINTYAAGTTTRVATYTDKAGATEHANPVILNTLGLPANPIWLKGGVSYKFVITDSADVVQRTVDDITGTNDPAVASSVDQWVLFTAVPTFISATSFSLAGDQTNTFQVGRRVKSANTGGTGYHTITASTFAASITTVTVTNDSVVLDTGISAVSYGLLSALDRSATAAAISNTPAGGITELDLQGVVNGLETRKLAKATGAHVNITANATLLAADAGKQHIVTGSPTITLPGVGAANYGISFPLLARSAFTLSAGADTIFRGITSGTSFAVPIGMSVTVTQGSNGWYLAAAGFSDDELVLGVGQTEQDVTASRALTTTYTNSTGRTIRVTVRGTGAANSHAVAFINGEARTTASAVTAGNIMALTFYVPEGGTYSVAEYINTFTIVKWLEMR